jgi:HrpA-like RNA helicase
MDDLPEYLDDTYKIGILDPEGINMNPLTNLPYSDTYKKLSKVWSKLPGYEFTGELLKSIKNNPLTIAIMETGTGKSVLIPKIALHYTAYRGKVGMSLPKRIITLSSAMFSAATLDVKLGEQIGYSYKGAKKEMSGPQNKILYMTDGVMTMKMVNDPDLTEYKVIIIDEAHERKVQIDMILLFLKKLLASGRRPDLRVILMSATINGNAYQKYFSGVKSNIIKVEGKTNYPIVTHFLPSPVKDYLKAGVEIIDSIIEKKIKKDMLFFITTSKEAGDTCKHIRPKYPKVYCVEVYADMEENMKIYAQDRDKFMELGDYDQKLVMATNVAESSLTIDGLKYVIDSCYELYGYFDPLTSGNILESRLISKAQALQRRGRTGRTEAGICYHLLTESQFNTLDNYPEPDILKQDITIDMLKIISQTDTKTFYAGVQTMNQLMDVPKQAYMDYSENLLTMYKILDSEGNMEPKLSKEILQFSSLSLNRSLFLIFAFQLHCAMEASIIVGMMEVLKGRIQSLFYKEDSICQSDCKKGARKYMKQISHNKSDHLTLLNIFNDFKAAKDKESWAKGHNIKLGLIRKVKESSHQYFHKLLQASKAPQIGGAKNVDLNRRIIEALKHSHKHLTANKLRTTNTKKVQEAHIQQSSFLHQHHSKNELSSKKIIYDSLMCANGSWEFSIVTII